MAEIRRRAAAREDAEEDSEAREPEPYSAEDVAEEVSWYEDEDGSGPVPAGGIRRSLVKYVPGAAVRVRVRLPKGVREEGEAKTEETAPVSEIIASEDVVEAIDAGDPELGAVPDAPKEAGSELGSGTDTEAEDAEEGDPEAAVSEGGSARETAKAESEDEEPEVAALAGAGPGPANGTEAAGGVPDRPDEDTSSKVWEAWASGFERKVVSVLEDQLKTLVGANKRAQDLLVQAVDERTGKFVEKVQTLDREEISVLVRAVGQFEDHFLAAKADETRRRDILAARRRYKWPVRGLVAAGVAALMFAGAAGEARWGLVQDYGAVDPATDAWRTIVWEEHGLKIAKCMKTARDRGPGMVCSVAARVK